MPQQPSHPPHEAGALASLSTLLEEWTGQQALVSRRKEPHLGADALVETGGLFLLVEVKQRADAATIGAVLAQAAKARERIEGAHFLLVVPYMTEAGRARCAEAGLSWADLSGNAHLQARKGDAALYVHVEGRPNRFPTRGRPRNAFAPKASRLARLLLSSPARAWTQAEIAEEAGLDPGYTSRLVKTLLKDDLVVRLDDGAIKIDDPELFLDAWAEANAYRHDLVEGHLPGRSGEERARHLQEVLTDAGAAFAFTGLAAAWAYTRAASFRSAACYLSGVPYEALDAAGFRAQTEAPNVRLLLPDDAGVFQGVRTVNGLRVVAPAQVFVDLQHEPERADEMAEALRPLALDPARPIQPSIT